MKMLEMFKICVSQNSSTRVYASRSIPDISILFFIILNWLSDKTKIQRIHLVLLQVLHTFDRVRTGSRLLFAIIERDFYS